MMNHLHTASTAIDQTEGLPIYLLPRELQDVVYDVSFNAKVPLSAALTAVLSVISVSTQGRIRVRRAPDLESPVSQWFILVQGSGERKSTVLRLLSKGLTTFSDEIHQKHCDELARYRPKKLAWDSEVAGLTRSISRRSEKGEDTSELACKLVELYAREPALPKTFKLRHDDSTSEGLRNCLSQCYSTTSLMSDEGLNVLQSDSFRNVSFLNSAWDGSSINTERSSVGSIKIKDPALSLFVAIQPGLFESFNKSKGNTLRDSGFYARCYVVKPASLAGTRQILGGISQSGAIDAFNDRSLEILRQHIDNQGNYQGKLTLTLSPQATEMWMSAFNAYESDMAPYGQLQNHKDLASKQAEKVARLAACIHYFYCNNAYIDEHSMRAAIAIGDWYLGSTMSALQQEIKPTDFQLDYNALYDWFRDHQRSSQMRNFRRSHILRSGPNRTRNRDRLNAVLSTMEALGLVRRFQQDPKAPVWIELICSFEYIGV